MSKIQEKMEETVSKLQSGIEGGKTKIQVTQEISKQRKNLKEISNEKVLILLKLGETTSKSLRNGAFFGEEFSQFKEKICLIDKEIYDIQKTIEQLSIIPETDGTCDNCGSKLVINDKFCGNCGNPVQEKEKSGELILKQCIVCITDIPQDSRYCPSCGFVQEYPLGNEG